MWKLWSIVCVSIRFLLRLKCFSVGITGLSFVCGKSWEGCDRAFYCAACKLAEGIATILVCHVIDIEDPSLWSIYSALYLSVKKKSLCSEGENLRNMASWVVIQLCLEKSFQHIPWETSMNLHLIHSSHHLSTICLFWSLNVSLKMNASEKMPPLPHLMWKGILLSVQTYGVVYLKTKLTVRSILLGNTI